jgi:hypothetical protein
MIDDFGFMAQEVLRKFKFFNPQFEIADFILIVLCYPTISRRVAPRRDACFPFCR